MGVDDPLDQGQADPRALDLFVQAGEEAEDLPVVFRRDAHAVVADVDHGPVRSIPDSDLHPRPELVSHVLDGVLDQILEHLQEAIRIA